MTFVPRHSAACDRCAVGGFGGWRPTWNVVKGREADLEAADLRANSGGVKDSFGYDGGAKHVLSRQVRLCSQNIYQTSISY